MIIIIIIIIIITMIIKKTIIIKNPFLLLSEARLVVSLHFLANRNRIAADSWKKLKLKSRDSGGKTKL